MQVCTSLQTDNHASTPPLSFYRPDALPAAQPTASKLDVETFRQELRRSALCCSEIVPEDVDSMADLYNSELNAIVN